MLSGVMGMGIFAEGQVGKNAIREINHL